MNATETHAANITFPAFEHLGFLDKAAYAIPYYAYKSRVWNYIDPDVLPFALSICTATFCVIAGSYATLSKPANALDPNVEVESELWDPSDRDDSRYIHTNASDLEFLNGTSIDFKQAVAMPVMSAGALYGLYYCLQNIDVTKLVYYLNWYLLIVSLTSNYSVSDFAITYLVRTILFWLRLPGNSLSVFTRYKATLSVDEKSDTFPLGQLEQVSASSFPNKTLEWFDGLKTHLASENVEILHPTSIPVINQKFNFVFDLKFFLLVPISIFLLTLYYLHNPALNNAYPFDTTNWLLANVMGINFAIFGIRVTRLSNFKVATGLLIALFFYDIYFVFGTKVMVTVATGIDIPIKIVYPRQPSYFATIGDLVFGSEGFKYWDVPTSLLGLGDIVIPGAFISACLRFDLYRHHQLHTSAFHHLRSFQKPYFYCAIVCYICSLTVTVVVLKIFGVGQPALLYIVPSLLLGVYGTGLAKGELKDLWGYSEHIEEYKPESDKNLEESDEEYVNESDDSYDEWEDRVESERAAAFNEVETDSDDIEVLASDLKRPVSRSLITYEFADSEDEDDDTFIIDGDEDEEELFIHYAMVSNEEIAILAKDRLTEPRAWYSDEEDN